MLRWKKLETPTAKQRNMQITPVLIDTVLARAPWNAHQLINPKSKYFHDRIARNRRFRLMRSSMGKVDMLRIRPLLRRVKNK